MTTRTIAALLGAAPLALDPVYGAELLASDIPSAAQSGTASALGVPQGERFAISRSVAVVPVRGILTPNNALLEKYLGWSTYTGLMDTAGDLAAADDVSAVVLDINSPGGLVLGCEGAVQAIAQMAKVKPVYALAAPLAASAAYWIGSQARELSLTPGATVGSIGVRADLSWPVAPGSDGQQRAIFTSAHAKGKAPDPTDARGQSLVQADIDALEARFLAAVAAGRKIATADLPARLSATDDPADGGGCFWPEVAVARGLADRIETSRDFYNRVLEAHAPKPRATGRARALSAQAAAAQAAANC
ncbi:S49 family peptidase [Thioclava sp. BHET1]|nr:S49 family peptidase [Thioclava sp. BHET1]